MSNSAAAETRTPTPDAYGMAASTRVASSDIATSATAATLPTSLPDVYVDSILDNRLAQDAVPALVAADVVGGGATAVAVAAADVQRPTTPLLRVKLSSISTSSSDSEGDESRLAVLGESVTVTTEIRTAASPPPTCVICLGRCKNKCFTDSCMHQFCFKCLCEWSKVKPECPLCKQTFKSIIHNVKSMDQFEEYHVQPPTVQIPNRPIEMFPPFLFDMEPLNWDVPRRANPAHRLLRSGSYFSVNVASGNSGSSSSGNGGANGGVAVQNQYIHRSELLDMYRQEAPDAIPNGVTLSQLWRRFIYDRKLYALPVCDITGRFRDSSARFYRDNPAQVHRLMPWISRDITCLLRNTEYSPSTVLEHINELLIQCNILSPAFRRRLQPYLGSKTSHFIHELNNFARSPYDMIGYDRAVQYLPQSPEEILIAFSSSDSSDEANSNEAVQRSERSRRREQSRAANVAAAQRPMVNLMSFTISTTSEGTEAPGVTVAVNARNTQSTAINLTTHNRAADPIIDLEALESMAAHVAATTNYPESAPTAPRISSTPFSEILLTSGSSDECEFVLERKPPHLRTPELVSLNSESDSDVIFVEETKPLRQETFSTTDDEQNEPSRKTRDRESVVKTTKSSTAAGASTSQASTTVKNEDELYNVGASTSTGLHSSGGTRGLRSLRSHSRHSSLRKRSLRSTKDEQKTSPRSGRKASISSDSETSVDESDDEDYTVRKRQTRVKSKKRSTRKVSRKRVTSSSHRLKRQHGKESDGVGGKRRKSSNVEKTDSENTSDCEYGKYLIDLRKQLQAQKASPDKDAECDDTQEEAMEEAEAPAPLASETAESENALEVKHERAKKENENSDAEADVDATERHDINDENCDVTCYSEQPCCSYQTTTASAHAAPTDATPHATEIVQVGTSTVAEEEDTFSSVTQTTTGTTTVTTTSTTTISREQERTNSRNSGHSFATVTQSASTNSDNSVSSATSSSGSQSAHSPSSAGEDDSNGTENATTEQMRYFQLHRFFQTPSPTASQGSPNEETVNEGSSNATTPWYQSLRTYEEAGSSSEDV